MMPGWPGAMAMDAAGTGLVLLSFGFASIASAWRCRVFGFAGSMWPRLARRYSHFSSHAILSCTFLCSLRHSQAQALPHANSSRLGGWASFFVALLCRGGANAAFRQQQHRRAASAATWIATGPWPHVAAEPFPDKLSRRQSWHLHSRPHLRVRCTYEAWLATRTWGSKDLWLGYGGLCILLTGSTPCRGPRPLRCALAS